VSVDRLTGQAVCDVRCAVCSGASGRFARQPVGTDPRGRKVRRAHANAEAARGYTLATTLVVCLTDGRFFVSGFLAAYVQRLPGLPCTS
jgi:hypothetical protein